MEKLRAQLQRTEADRVEAVEGCAARDRTMEEMRHTSDSREAAMNALKKSLQRETDARKHLENTLAVTRKELSERDEELETAEKKLQAQAEAVGKMRENLGL